MATPILTKNQKAACLSKAVPSSKKVRVKNVLCVDSHSWPRPSKEVEETILTKLTELLRSLPNIFKPVKNSTKDYLESKRKVRAQLDLGTNCVARSLETDRLACVLVSGKVAPAPALDHLIAVARERGCPLLCLDALSTTLAKASKSKCFPICIGFKKLVTSARADFVEVITLVKENSTTRKSASKAASIGKGLRGQRNQLPETMRPVRLDPSTDTAIRKDLTSAFSKASLKEGKNKMWTSRDKKRRKDKNKKKFKEHYKKWFHNHFESGKRTVADFVARGKLQMVLVIPELIPILMTEAPASSLLYVARDADCPVLCVSNLAAVTCVESEKALAVLGIKKDSCLPMNCPSAFSSVIEKCHEFMRHAPMPTQEMDVGDDDDGEMKNGGVKEEVVEGDGGVDYSFLYVKKNESTELREKAIRLKEEQDETSKQFSFSGDFISLSGADGSVTTSPAEVALGKRKSANPLFGVRLQPSQPKKMLIDKTGKKQNDGKVQGQTQANIAGDSQGFLSFGTSAPKQEDSTEAMSMDQEEAKGSTSWINSGNDASHAPMFSISRAGDRSHNKLSASEKEKEVEEAGPSSTESGSSILGFDASAMAGKSASEVEAAHVTNVFSATSRKSKGEDKRRHGQEGFVSFGYTEANIQTMVANPNRKNRSKKK